MKRIKVIALAMTVLMLQPLLLACSAKNKDVTVVKEDDPWYESSRFGLENDQLPTELIGGSVVSYSNGNIYHLYSLTNMADYDNYRRTMLDTYDSEGKQTGHVKIKDPDGYAIDNIFAVRINEDGKTAEAVVTLFAPGGFPSGMVTLDLESGTASNTRLFEKEPGQELEVQIDETSWAGISDVYIAGEYNIPVITTGFMPDEIEVHAFVFRGSEYQCDLDFSGMARVSVVEGFSYDSKNNKLLTVGRTLVEGPVVIEFEPETGKRIRYEKYTAQAGDGVSLADYKTVATGELCRIDMLGNITEFDLQTQEVKTRIDNNWYTPYFSDLAGRNVQLVACDDDTAVIFSSDSTDYSMFFAGMEETVTVLKKADKNPHAGKKVIELAAPIDKAITEYLSNAVYEFNRTDDEYLIRVWSKYKTGIIAGRNLSMLDADEEKLYTMIQELKGSEAPDIAIGIQKNYVMRDDVFADLTGYLDKDVMDKQFANIIEASKIGDKQYFLPVTLEIEGLITDTSLISDGACGITFEDFDRMIEQDLDGFSPYDYPMSEYNYKKDFILSCIDTKAAIEGKNVDFGTDQFRAAVSYSDEHFAQDGTEKPDDYIFEEETRRVRTGCRYDKIESYIDFIHACNDNTASYTIIGTPSVDASGPRFRAIETISVTASSEIKDGAKKFINFLFAGAGFGDSSREFQNIVTNKEIMERNISIISEKNNTGEKVDEEMSNYMTGLGDLNTAFGYKYSTKDMEKQMMNSLSSISTYYYDDPVITAFLVEEIAPYYAGDRSLDDVIKIINDRANKYIKEM